MSLQPHMVSFRGSWTPRESSSSTRRHGRGLPARLEVDVQVSRSALRLWAVVVSVALMTNSAAATPAAAARFASVAEVNATPAVLAVAAATWVMAMRSGQVSVAVLVWASVA